MVLTRLIAIACALASVSAGASISRIDDSGTVVSQPVAPMRWRKLVPGRGVDNTVEATLRVDVRLNLAPWLNRSCRIHLVLAPTLQAPVTVRWTTQGRLLAGQLTSGQRVVVFQGVAGPAVLAESMLLTIETDGTSLARTEQLQFHFEIETTP